MIYPTITEYIEAIRFSEDNFDKLTNLVPVLKDNGEPYYSSGNFAVVFKMKDKETGKLHAVKCFLKDQEGREERYKLIAEELDKVDSPYILKIKYLDKELFVNSKSTDETEFPVLLMDWVEGVPLDVYLRQCIDEVYTWDEGCEITITHTGGLFPLSLLAHCFCEMAKWLLVQPFAHGDLKPDNIIVRDNGLLTLVDYDGMFVPKMFGQKSPELGSPDFQNPNRQNNYFDRHIDDLALLSISISLISISVESELLKEFGAEDRLLFSVNDYKDIFQSPLLKKLMESCKYKVFDLCSLMIKVLMGGVLLDDDCNKFYCRLSNVDCNEGLELMKAIVESDVDYCEVNSLYGYTLLANNENRELGLGLIYDGVSRKNAFAEEVLGNCYRYKYFMPQNKCIDWYLKSAEKGNSYAQYALGKCYEEGEFVPQDYGKAFEWYLKSSERGNLFACLSVGHFYEYGYYVEVDKEMAMYYYCKADYFDDRLADEIYRDEQKYAIYKDLVKNGGASDQLEFANYLFSINEYGLAVELYTKSAEQGNAEAQYKLGRCYLGGDGVEKDSAMAVKWFGKSATKGNADAQYELGRCFEKGDGVKYNRVASVRWYTNSANQNNAEAQYCLGIYYYDHKFVPNNLTKAIEWLTKSAENGMPLAQYKLGLCYFDGEGVDKDFNKAFELFSWSVNQGNAEAQLYLGYCYRDGRGVVENRNMALEWFAKSANNGCTMARLQSLFLQNKDNGITL